MVPPKIGCGIVGPSAGDLIAEAALAIEMGADADRGPGRRGVRGTITGLYLPQRS